MENMDDVLVFIRKLNAPPIVGGEECMSHEKKTELSTAATNAGLSFTAEQIWNVAAKLDQTDFVNGEMKGRDFVRWFSHDVARYRLIIEKDMAHHLQSKGGKDMMGLMRFHSNAENREEVVPIMPRVSLDALSDPGSSSASSVGKSLTVDKIHHNMLSEPDHQTFSKFAFPEDDDILGTLLEAHQQGVCVRLKKIAEDLRTIRKFLSCFASCDEHFTQAVFTVFLTSLLEGIDQDDEEKGNYSAQNVSGMNALRVNAVVSAAYLNAQHKKKKTQE
uniref:Uncharacterized protein n=1 Tax=Attheya septentrionalis TaxID=420275 RepID=A0A7S2XKY7_9STRA|mmetsp:Transcript_10457/g.19063  ORF Transcript_10457/g.19063 Transcript_10457/m.19063 type:complete len:275 (+) Transcript_10457:273-1097(+)